MDLYGAIDLHSNNCFAVLIDQEDRVEFEMKLPNHLDTILARLAPYKERIRGIAVESTFNWYWLVDGLMEHGYQVRLVATSAVKQYEGLKHADDRSDARWLAQMLKLGILPTGYIYPKEERAVRDLCRKRLQLVRQRTTNILSLENLCSRNLGVVPRCNQVVKWEAADLDEMLKRPELALAAKSNLAVIRCLDDQIKVIEKETRKRAKLRREYGALLTVDGIGEVLAMTISLEAGELGRFRKVGNFASYCRCVGSKWLSNGKKKAEGNRKNGNKYLAWAFVEAAAFAIRYNEDARRFYQRKAAKANQVVARKAVANKMARACYYVMRDGVPFESKRAFG
jgi:transposase